PAPYAVIEQLFSTESSASVHLNCIASVATMIRVVCDGLGVAAVPPAIIQRELAEQRLRLLRVDREFPSLPLVACFRNDHQNPLTEVVARAAE
ncbi:LysR substrate-binding domain-containing protein, partial [Pseudomonas promysalinigenes]|uniref:LysR substrate-binding domain-containing protein n=1 Tax=Pseudomonas promysalinigenes TaxID=485898 RepID=UPI003FA00201